MPKASVIIINYNTANLTLQCLESFYSFYSKELFEVILVDNASKASDYKHLNHQINLLYPKVKLVRSRINLGFGGGNMFGVQHATTPYYVFVNSDVIFIEDCLSPMLRFLEDNEQVSIVGCNSIDENNQHHKPFHYKIDLWSEIFGDAFLNTLAPKKYPNRKINYTEAMRVGSFQGSLFVTKASDFDAVGGFDTNLFLYYEEKDLSYRIEKQLKKQVYLLPQYQHVHLQGKSTAPSFLISKELKISQFYTIKKHLPWLVYAIFYLFQILQCGIKGIFSSKNRKYTLLLLKGISVADSLKHKQVIAQNKDIPTLSVSKN